MQVKLNMQVKFPMNEQVWDAVVTNSVENMFVESQGVDSFIVEYDTEEDFIAALERFEGVVEYEELV